MVCPSCLSTAWLKKERRRLPRIAAIKDQGIVLKNNWNCGNCGDTFKTVETLDGRATRRLAETIRAAAEQRKMTPEEFCAAVEDKLKVEYAHVRKTSTDDLATDPWGEPAGPSVSGRDAQERIRIWRADNIGRLLGFAGRDACGVGLIVLGCRDSLGDALAAQQSRHSGASRLGPGLSDLRPGRVREDDEGRGEPTGNNAEDPLGVGRGGSSDPGQDPGPSSGEADRQTGLRGSDGDLGGDPLRDEPVHGGPTARPRRLSYVLPGVVPGRG